MTAPCCWYLVVHLGATSLTVIPSPYLTQDACIEAAREDWVVANQSAHPRYFACIRRPSSRKRNQDESNGNKDK